MTEIRRKHHPHSINVFNADARLLQNGIERPDSGAVLWL
jgi:hypothetical protein